MNTQMQDQSHKHFIVPTTRSVVARECDTFRNEFKIT